MFRYRREMYALQLKYLYIALLIIASIGFNEAIANGRSRRRFGPESSKSPSDEVTEKSKADQAVAASSHTESNQYRRGGSYSTDAGDYTYNSADINVIRPESKPLHTKITAKYTSSITIPHDSFEDTETAEEYVAKAMGMYGSRLREPIRIPNEAEPTPNEPSQQQQQQLQHQQLEQQYQQHLQQQQQQKQQHEEQKQQHEQHEQRLQQYQHEQHEQRLQQHQQEQHHHEQQLQNFQSQEKPNNNIQYYTYQQKEVQPQQVAATPIVEEEEEPQQQQQQHQQQLQVPYHQYSPSTGQTAETENDAKHLVEAQIQAQLQEQIQKAQYLVQERQQEQAQAEEQIQLEQSPAPAKENDAVTRSYNVYDEQTEGYEQAQQSVVDRNYRTKYVYKPASSQYHTMSNENEEKIRVSASTEIPKAEIMKQIEKSVIRYMKELEAEGKIIAAPHKEEPKTYYKVITVNGSDEKRIGSTTSKPVKYVSSSSNSGNYQDQGYKQQHSPSPSPQKYYKHAVNKPTYQTETESSYQAAAHDVAELTPNVEFIYKIKTKAPLHTATVKTVSKPYNLPIKSYEEFDHSSALKNLEDFDLSHVVSTADPEDHQSASTSKPNKLYFNSEIYHDINSLPYKKQQQRAEAEYRKLKAAAADLQSDYKGYSGSSSSHSQSGYYAEPPADRESDRDNSNVSEDGYPMMNPYKYVLKKEALPGKYDESPSGYEPQQQQTQHQSLQQQHNQKYKSLEYDSYNPKFNNNPEGYGYQQTYKTHLSNRHSPTKRGKRGGSPYAGLNKKSPHRSSNSKEFEDFALRPPPKN